HHRNSNKKQLHRIWKESFLNWLGERSFGNIIAFAYRNLMFTKRNLFVFAEILFWPMVSLFSVGLMGDFLRLEDLTLSFILTGAITQGVIQVTQLDVSYSLLYDIWSKSVKHTFLAPVKEYQYLIGSWFIGILRGSAVFIILSQCARIIFGYQLPRIVPVLIFLTGLYLCALIIGMSVCSLVLFFGQRVEVTAWSLAIFLMLISGIYYPISMLPGPFPTIAEFIPITYFLEYIRSFHRFTPVLDHLLIKGFGLGIMYFFILRFTIYLATKKACRSGMILRLSE
ncbi:MAG: ABC transporter permease, partial [Elusimicrobia bacterium]|nr:ABC transporter permease [Elusimicrobiota bacterium]MBD3411625.1 ABC transporter permease [Elusimicrobiota bacterium]